MRAGSRLEKLSWPVVSPERGGVSALPVPRISTRYADAGRSHWLKFLGLTLLGYAVLGKGWAYVGYPPLFIGERLCREIVLPRLPGDFDGCLSTVDVEVVEDTHIYSSRDIVGPTRLSGQSPGGEEDPVAAERA